MYNEMLEIESRETGDTVTALAANLEEDSIGAIVLGDYLKFKEGTLYPALHRLEQSGLLQGNWQTIASGRQRRYYSITEKGRRIMVEQTEQWQDFFAAMNLIFRPRKPEVQVSK